LLTKTTSELKEAKGLILKTSSSGRYFPEIARSEASLCAKVRSIFLISMQIGVAINFRNIDRTFAQSEASERAISGQFASGDRMMEVNPFGTFNALGILITRKFSSIPILIPFIGSFINKSHRSEVTGIAVIENLS